MNTGWGLHEIGVHRLLRHKLATHRTAKHHIAVRRKTDGIVIKLPVVPVLASREQTAHHKNLALGGDKEGITHGSYPKLAIPVFYHRLDMGIVQHLGSEHGFLLHIDEVKSITLGTQPHYSIRIQLSEGRVEVAVLRHASHLHLLYLSRFRRKDSKMHTLHKQQDISIGQLLHLGFMVIIGTWNRDGIRLQVIKAETQELSSLAAYIQSIAHLQSVAKQRLQHGRFVEHIGTFIADTATRHLVSAHHPGMLIIIFHDVVQIDFLGCGNRIEDISEWYLSDATVLQIIDKHPQGCTSQQMISHRSHAEHRHSLGSLCQRIIVGFLVSNKILRNNLKARIAVTHPEIITMILEGSTHHLYGFAQDRKVFWKRSLEMIGLYLPMGWRNLLIPTDMKCTAAIAYQHRHRIIFFPAILYSHDVIMIIGQGDAMEAVSPHIPGESVLRTHPHSAGFIKMKHVDIVIGQGCGILDIVAELHEVLAIIYIDTSRCTNPHQLSPIASDRRNALRREHIIFRRLFSFFLQCPQRSPSARVKIITGSKQTEHGCEYDNYRLFHAYKITHYYRINKN